MRGPPTTMKRLEVGTQWKSCRNSAGEDGEVGTGLRCTEEETERDLVLGRGERDPGRCPGV